MEWKKDWEGKYIFVKLKSGAVYSGKIVSVDDNDPLIVFFSIIDKFGQRVTFIHSEIIRIKEENPNGE